MTAATGKTPKRPTKTTNTMRGKSPGQRFADGLRSLFGLILDNSFKFALASALVVLLALFFIGISILSSSRRRRA